MGAWTISQLALGFAELGRLDQLYEAWGKKYQICSIENWVIDENTYLAGIGNVISFLVIWISGLLCGFGVGLTIARNRAIRIVDSCSLEEECCGQNWDSQNDTTVGPCCGRCWRPCDGAEVIRRLRRMLP